MTYARNILTTMLAFLAVVALTGCHEDAADDIHTRGDTQRTVTLRLSTAPCVATRSAAYADGIRRAAWQDKNASDKGEMMHNCFVVVVQDGKIQNIISDNFDDGERENTLMKTTVKEGETTFYSFANVSLESVGLDGITSFPADLPEGFDDRWYSARGNCTGVDAEGIPMSNKQTVVIDESTTDVSLEVIRMFAKIRLSLDNASGYDLNLKSISLTDITENADNNIHMLPRIVATGIVMPWINPQAAYADYKMDFSQGGGLHIDNSRQADITFYVNESMAHDPGYFVLTIDTDKGTVTKRIAMTRFKHISRGDYLIIPVKLVDFRIEMEAEAFTAIGVKPEVKNDAERITITFGSYGEFHMRPRVYNRYSGTELSNWTIGSISTLEASPEGEAGTCIYDEMPEYNASTKLIEGFISPRKGYAIHEIEVKIDGVAYTIPYRIMVVKK